APAKRPKKRLSPAKIARENSTATIVPAAALCAKIRTTEARGAAGRAMEARACMLLEQATPAAAAINTAPIAGTSHEDPVAGGSGIDDTALPRARRVKAAPQAGQCSQPIAGHSWGTASLAAQFEQLTIFDAIRSLLIPKGRLESAQRG